MRLSFAVLFQPVNRRRDRLLHVQPVQRAGVDHLPGVFFIRRAGKIPPAFRFNNRRHRQVVRAGEDKIATVVGRHRHDRPAAVGQQHEIRNPDRQFGAGHRMDRRQAGIHAGFLTVDLGPFQVRFFTALRHVGRYRRALLIALSTRGCSGASTMKVAAPQGVRAGGKDLQPFVPALDAGR